MDARSLEQQLGGLNLRSNAGETRPSGLVGLPGVRDYNGSRPAPPPAYEPAQTRKQSGPARIPAHNISGGPSNAPQSVRDSQQRHQGLDEKKLAEPAQSLTETQREVLNRVVEDRENVFYTGGAGTGKSYLLSHIISRLKHVHDGNVAVTAPTGIAAVNINGCTLHSFVGVGLFEPMSAATIAQNILRSRRACSRWTNVRVLVIDEISMVSGDTFDKLEAVARIVRRNEDVFGGIQIIVTGDFFQLPPIAKGSAAKFAFEAESWNRCFGNNMLTVLYSLRFILEKIFRQEEDALIRMLNEVRNGRPSKESVDLLKSLSRPIPNQKMEPTKLFARRDQVDTANSERLGSIPGLETIYEANDIGTDSQKSKLMESCLAVEKLTLKPGVQVMLLRNLKFEDYRGNTELEFANGSLGVVIECKPAFVVVEFYPSGAISGEVVGVGARETRLVSVYEQEWSIKDAEGATLASRRQIPLMLSYALSIHKSQGQSLQCVQVDLDRVFEKGQAYVALSRATCLDGLQVLNFDESKIRADRRVAEFYSRLE
ncbi:hypothetical protein CcCBS67573_g03050 [Chytriomyces confervae]|uniref:ATP-dependent DNA helicase n=1 Tax=Chytriomyces confervae TaxID=246404 RepID=A0A507FHK3_9FUNG|nr:hypothetical protein CcCBS67573_g03050 [Chytriomyces confervae]